MIFRRGGEFQNPVFKRDTGLLLTIFFGVLLMTNPLLAGPTATLSGRITDPSGSVIAGVKVEATNVETNVTFPTETNEEGLYAIPNLPPGTYRVVVQKAAFRTIVKPDVELHVQDVITLNFSMELGPVEENVTVEAKDKRNKRHAVSIRRICSVFPAVAASHNAFYVFLRRELPESAAFFRGGRHSGPSRPQRLPHRTQR